MRWAKTTAWEEDPTREWDQDEKSHNDLHMYKLGIFGYIRRYDEAWTRHEKTREVYPTEILTQGLLFKNWQLIFFNIKYKAAEEGITTRAAIEE